MKLKHKIIIGSLIGFAAGYGIFRLVYNYRLKKADQRVTPDIQKELLIQQLLILKGIPDTDANRNQYRSKTVQEINAEINQNSNQAVPPDEGSFYESTGVTDTSFIDSNDLNNILDSYGSYV